MINVFGSDLSTLEINAVSECIQSQWVGFGKQVSTFENNFEKSQQVENFLMVDSGSNALYMACHLLDLKPGDKVIVPTYTWVSCAQAVLLCGLQPIFADVDKFTMNITLETIKQVLTPDVKAIMVVHYAGLSVDLDPIRELGLPIIEDAAHAVDATYKGQQCGNIGEIGIFSFDAVKNLTAIEGGGICFKSSSLYERAKRLRYCGIGKSGFESISETKSNWWEYHISEPFIKMLPTNLHAAVADVQLTRLASLQQRRSEIWEMYDEGLRGIPGITLPVHTLPSEKHGMFTYCICVPRRNELAKFLLDQKIYTTLRYHPLHLNNLYGSTKDNLENSIYLNSNALSLPIHPRLSDNDVDFIVDRIKMFYSH